MKRLITHFIDDEGKREIANNILNCRKTDMGFVYSCIEASSITGEDIVGMVKEYDAEQKEKRDEAAKFSE